MSCHPTRVPTETLRAAQIPPVQCSPADKGRRSDVRLGPSGGRYEQEADLVAAHIVGDRTGLAETRPVTISPLIQRDLEVEEEEIQAKPAAPCGHAHGPVAQAAEAVSRGGHGLPAPERMFFEQRFGRDLSAVRIHTGDAAGRAARAIRARAYTLGNHIAFAPGEYQPGTNEGRRLMAHELVHSVQQSGLGSRASGYRGQVQRVVELRPPGRGEASAFDRVDELVDRFNQQSPAIQYQLNGRQLEYTVVDEAALSNFDRKMREYIDNPATVPMRLITSAGRLGGQSPLIDDFESGYVDLDDLLGSDDVSFQLNVIHVLTERFSIRDYDRRIGTNIGGFNRAHRAGIDDEAAHLRSVVGDPTIRFNYEETRPNGSLVFAFKSDEGYRIFHVFRGANRAERSGTIFVRTRDGRRLTLDELIAERQAAAAAPAPAPAPAEP